MKLLSFTLLTLLSAALIAAAAVYAGTGSGSAGEPPTRAAAGSAAVIPLKDAKLNIEHNATDNDTGFQGFVDSEGWRRLDVRGPGGQVLSFE
ncbi:MAG: hypothetical protein H0U05_07810, partial [Actinobacteria bacterium]|nr:hypothetical protein [Actinomycetota bacterium]